MANDTSEQKRGESDVSVSKCKFCSWMWQRSVSGVLSSLLKRKIFTQIYQTLNIWINYSLWVIKTHKKMTTTSSSTQLQIVITYQSWNAMVRSILKDLIQSRLADVGGRLGVKKKRLEALLVLAARCSWWTLWWKDASAGKWTSEPGLAGVWWGCCSSVPWLLLTVSTALFLRVTARDVNYSPHD